MTTTRTYDQIHNDITDETTRLLPPGNDYDFGRAFGEKSRRLAGLWSEIAWLAARDKDAALLCLSARMLADRYAADAERYHC